MGQSKHHIGLFGGSFDPPHLGHIALAQAGLDAGLDEVWVIPALPVHRELSGHADGYMRLDWLQCCFADEPRIKVLDWEVAQQQPVPSIATLRRFRNDFPHIQPWLMLGVDAWNGLANWQAYPEHQAQCNALIFARQGEAGKAFKRHDGWKKLRSENWPDCTKAGHYYHINVTLPDISATNIRQRLALGLSLAGLVPKVLQQAIEQQYKK